MKARKARMKFSTHTANSHIVMTGNVAEVRIQDIEGNLLVRELFAGDNVHEAKNKALDFIEDNSDTYLIKGETK